MVKGKMQKHQYILFIYLFITTSKQIIIIKPLKLQWSLCSGSVLLPKLSYFLYNLLSKSKTKETKKSDTKTGFILLVAINKHC